jgi:hypothetical protein
MAATVTSSNFSLGFGYTEDPFGWTTVETSSANTPTALGDFTFVPTVTSSNNSSGGCTFPGRVLTDQLAGQNGRSANGDGFAATVTGTYTGPTPGDAAPDPNYQISVNISSISLYVCAYAAEANPFGFAETTAGHAALSPTFNDPVPPNNATLASNYTHLVWDPDDYSVAGTTSTRTFGLSSPGLAGGNLQIDGYEITGTVTLTYDVVPEPSSIACFAAIGAAAVVRRRPRRH